MFSRKKHKKGWDVRFKNSQMMDQAIQGKMFREKNKNKIPLT
jgi:hypothetical protein